MRDAVETNEDVRCVLQRGGNYYQYIQEWEND